MEAKVEQAYKELKKVYEVPEGLVDLTRDMARQIFYHKPENAESFLADYLEGKLENDRLRALGLYPYDANKSANPVGEGCVNILGESMGPGGKWLNNLLENFQNPNGSQKETNSQNFAEEAEKCYHVVEPSPAPSSLTGLNGVLDDLEGMADPIRTPPKIVKESSIIIDRSEHLLPEGFQLLGVDLTSTKVKDVPTKLNPGSSQNSRMASDQGISILGTAPRGSGPIFRDLLTDSKFGAGLVANGLSGSASERVLNTGQDMLPSGSGLGLRSESLSSTKSGSGSGQEKLSSNSKQDFDDRKPDSDAAAAAATMDGLLSKLDAQELGSKDKISGIGILGDKSSEQTKSSASGQLDKSDGSQKGAIDPIGSAAQLRKVSSEPNKFSGQMDKSDGSQKANDQSERSNTRPPSVPTIMEELPGVLQPFLQPQSDELEVLPYATASRPDEESRYREPSNNLFIIYGLSAVLALVAGYYLGRYFGYLPPRRRSGWFWFQSSSLAPTPPVNISVSVGVENRNFLGIGPGGGAGDSSGAAAAALDGGPGPGLGKCPVPHYAPNPEDPMHPLRV